MSSSCDKKNAPPSDSGNAQADVLDSTEAPAESAAVFERGNHFDRDVTGNCKITGRVQDAQGRPQAGSQIFFRLLDEPWLGSHVPKSWTSGSDGRFAAAGLACDIPMQAWAVDAAGRRASVDRFLAEDLVELTLEDSGSLQIELDTKLDIGEDLYILLAGDAMWPPRSLTIPTPKSKRLLVRALPSGAYSIIVSSRLGAFVSSRLVHVKTSDTARIEARLSSASPPRALLIDQDTGEPVPDAPVLLRGPIEVLQIVRRTDSDGEAVFPPLPENLAISIEGLAFGVLSEVAQGTASEEITAQVPARSVIEGVVKTTAGEPLSQVEITAEIPHGNRSVDVTSASGQFFLAHMLDAAAAGWPALISVKDGFAPGPARIPIPAAGGEAKPTLEPGRGLTDADGRFELTMRRPGRVALRAEHPEYVMMRPTELALPEKGTLEPVTITLYPGLTVQVTVSGGDERPVPQAEVSAYGPDDALLATGRTQDDGTISLSGMPPNVRIEAQAPGTVPAFSRVFGRLGRTVKTGITLGQADRILKGSVLDAGGNPISGAAVTARSNQRGTLHVLLGITDRAGAFSLPEAGAGDYRVVADAGEKGRAQLSSVNDKTDIKLVVEPQPQVANSNETWGNEVDDLGVTGNRAAALQRGTPQSPPGNFTDDSFNTQYGSVDQLVVTGPPPGRGGLPIELGPAGNKRGARVTSVSPGSHVAEAGLGRGDLIVSVDGKKIAGPAQARRAIEGAIGSVVMLEVQSEDGPFTVVVQRVRLSSGDR